MSSLQTTTPVSAEDLDLGQPVFPHSAASAPLRGDSSPASSDPHETASLRRLLSKAEGITERWFTDAETAPQPPSITDISQSTLALRRLAALHRDIIRLENPDARFPREKSANPNSHPAPPQSYYGSASSGPKRAWTVCKGLPGLESDDAHDPADNDSPLRIPRTRPLFPEYRCFSNENGHAPSVTPEEHDEFIQSEVLNVTLARDFILMRHRLAALGEPDSTLPPDLFSISFADSIRETGFGFLHATCQYEASECLLANVEPIDRFSRNLTPEGLSNLKKWFHKLYSSAPPPDSSPTPTHTPNPDLDSSSATPLSTSPGHDPNLDAISHQLHSPHPSFSSSPSHSSSAFHTSPFELLTSLPIRAGPPTF